MASHFLSKRNKNPKRTTDSISQFESTPGLPKILLQVQKKLLLQMQEVSILGMVLILVLGHMLQLLLGKLLLQPLLLSRLLADPNPHPKQYR